MKIKKLTLLTSIVLIFASQAGLVYSEQWGATDLRGPPPEAYSACEGKSAGDEGQFEDRRAKILTGICQEDNGKLVLRPNRSDK